MAAGSLFFAAGIAGFTAHQFNAIAHRYAPPSGLAPFSYTELLLLAFACWLVFSDPPDIWFYLGAPVIIRSGVYIWFRERQLRRPVTEPVEGGGGLSVASAVKPIEDRRLLGIGMMLATYLCYTIIDSCTKLMTQAGMPTMEVVFVRYAGQFILVLAFFLPQQGIRALTATRNLKVEIVRGLCLLGSTITSNLALTYLPLTVTSAISFTMPLILCAPLHPNARRDGRGGGAGLRSASALPGVLIIVRPGTEAIQRAVILSLITAVFSALYNLLTRKLAGVDLGDDAAVLGFRRGDALHRAVLAGRLGVAA